MADIKVELIDHMGSDLTVVNAARVSFNKESKLETVYTPGYEGPGNPHGVGSFKEGLSDKDAKLISYLATHKHWTPFAHCQATFRIKAPIFVARQLFKHKVGLTENEVSRRYVDDEPEMFWPKAWRKRSETAKQGSSEELIDLRHFDPSGNPLSMEDACSGWVADLEECVDMHYQDSERLYNAMLNAGVCPEQARMVLPQSMMTEWWWTGSLAAFARVYGLRTDPHAQQETRDVAHSIGIHLCRTFPVSWSALVDPVQPKKDKNQLEFTF